MKLVPVDRVASTGIVRCVVHQSASIIYESPLAI